MNFTIYQFLLVKYIDFPPCSLRQGFSFSPAMLAAISRIRGTYGKSLSLSWLLIKHGYLPTIMPEASKILAMEYTNVPKR